MRILVIARGACSLGAPGQSIALSADIAYSNYAIMLIPLFFVYDVQQ